MEQRHARQAQSVRQASADADARMRAAQDGTETLEVRQRRAQGYRDSHDPAVRESQRRLDAIESSTAMRELEERTETLQDRNRAARDRMSLDPAVRQAQIRRDAAAAVHEHQTRERAQQDLQHTLARRPAHVNADYSDKHSVAQSAHGHRPPIDPDPDPEKQCGICFEETKKSQLWALVPCGHQFLCQTCALRVVGTGCPTCRKRVDLAIQIFA
jgi:Zinc finger, C3HC4 type (RING finger)